MGRDLRYQHRVNGTGLESRRIGYLYYLQSFNLLRPDYPSKVFYDKRISYVLMMEALAADSAK